MVPAFRHRGLLQLIVGEDVEAILAITALGTLAYLIVVKGNYEVLGSFVNLLIFVVVFSFFARLTRVLIRTIQAAQAGRNPT